MEEISSVRYNLESVDCYFSLALLPLQEEEWEGLQEGFHEEVVLDQEEACRVVELLLAAEDCPHQEGVVHQGVVLPEEGLQEVVPQEEVLLVAVAIEADASFQPV